MVNYKCNVCKKIFTQKGHYKRHINRKFKCSLADNDNIEYKYFCTKCNKGFTRESHLIRHIQRKTKCDTIDETNSSESTKQFINIIKNKIDEQNKKLKEKEEEIKKLKEELSNKDKLKPKVNYGEECTDYITHTKMKYCLLEGLDGDIELFKDIYFNPEHPENRTIEIKKGDKIIFMRYINGKWIQTEKDKISKDFLSKSRKLYRNSLQYKSDNGVEITDDERECYDKKISWDADYHTKIEKGIFDIVINNS